MTTPRNPRDLCNLCQSNQADKTNSHIIPKFLCKGLFVETKPRHTLIIDRQGKGRKLQDTPKENYLLCSHCEKRIEVLETYFAPIINEIHNYSNLPTKFKLCIIGNQQYIECTEIHATRFKLFIYSLVWRTSISNLIEFNKFKLPQETEENLRRFLNQGLAPTKKEFIESSSQPSLIAPLYHSYIIKPKVKSELSRGIFSGYNLNETSHLLFLIDFGLMFYSGEDSLGKTLEVFSNRQNDKVIITLGDLTPWQDLNKIILSKLLN